MIILSHLSLENTFVLFSRWIFSRSQKGDFMVLQILPLKIISSSRLVRKWCCQFGWHLSSNSQLVQNQNVFLMLKYMQLQLWTLLHNSSHSIKEPNQTSIIRTSISIFTKIVFFLRVGLLFLKITLGTGFQSVKSTFVFRRKR